MEEEVYYSTSSRRETETETTLLLAAASSSSFSYYNPCYCLEVAIRSFLKCLGLGRSSSKEQEQDQEVELEEEEQKNNQSGTQDVDVDVDPSSPPTSTDQTGKQNTEDAGVTTVVSRGIRRSNVRFPRRPPIRRGRPGEINSTSPS